jgi:hypothetical protein
MANGMTGYEATQRQLNPENYLISMIDKKNCQVEMAKGKVRRKHNYRFPSGKILTWISESAPETPSTIKEGKVFSNHHSRQSRSSESRRMLRNNKW